MEKENPEPRELERDSAPVEPKAHNIDAKDERENGVKTLLFLVNREMEKNESNVQLIEESMNYIEHDLKHLEVEFPKDKDIALLRVMYEDLKNDLEALREPQLDDSFDSLLNEMQVLVKEKGVRRNEVGELETGSSLRNTVDAISKMGIKVEYVVQSNVDQTRTVVLFMQVHPNPGMSAELRDALGVSKSQEQIFSEASKIIDTGMIDVVFSEGLVRGREFEWTDNHEMISDENRAVSADFRLEEKYKDRVETVGSEEALLFRDTLEHMPDANVAYYRMTVHNIFIAQNIVASLNSLSKETAIIPFGAAHESFSLLGGKGHPLSLSETLAYYGCNVIVVDAASEYLDYSQLLARQNEINEVTLNLSK